MLGDDSIADPIVFKDIQEAEGQFIFQKLEDAELGCQ
jgi:hypothetical protein